MPNDKNRVYRTAVIGVGRAVSSGVKGGGHQIGYEHARMYQNNSRTELVAAADIDAENLAAFQNTFGVERGFADYKEMLAEVEPDIVSICTYVGLHRAMIEVAVEAGVPAIICEKPFVASPADLAAVKELAAKSGVKIIVPHFRRYRPAFARAKELYAGGAVGEPLMCIAGIEGWDLSEWGSHWLDMFRFFHNDRPVRWVFGQVRVRDLRGYGHAMEDHGVAYFEFEGGGKGILDGGRGMNGTETMTLVGTEGTLRVLGEHAVVIEDANGRRTESFEDHPETPVAAAWQRMLSDLVAWLDGGPEPILGLTNVAKTSELNLAAYISALRGDRVDLPLTDALDEWPLEVIARRGAPPK